MASTNHPWEQIFRNRGGLFKEPFTRFFEVVKSFKKHECKCILDLGCGNGRQLIQFLKEGFDVLGMDISLTALRLAQDWVQEDELKTKVIHD